MNGLIPLQTWPPRYRLKKHRRARYVKLTAAKPHGLQITVPYRFNLKELPQILDEHKEWIIQQLNILELDKTEELPTSIRLHSCNEEWIITYQSSKHSLKLYERFALKEILITGDHTEIAICRKKLIDWLKRKSRDYLTPLLSSLSEEMQLPFSRISIRGQETRWGSCTRDKSIQLNYKLLFLPDYLVKHVLIHELAHIKYLNHGERFWELVAKYDPDWQGNKRALRKAEQWVPKFF